MSFVIERNAYFGRVYRYGARFAFQGGNGWYVGHDDGTPSEGPYRTLSAAKAHATRLAAQASQ